MNKENTQEIIELYKAGEFPIRIGEKFQITEEIVLRILRNNGFNRNRSAPRVSQEEIKTIIKRYQDGESSEKIAADLEINGVTVCHYLKKNNISIRPGTENKVKHQKNHNFFDKIDREESAYFLGMMYADGSVPSRGESCLKLGLKDRDVIEKFSNLIFGKELIKNYNDEGFYVVYVYSKHMRKTLIDHGCVPDKVFKIRYPNIESNLHNHFIRGHFDGDGCLSINKNNKPVLDFTSNLNFLADLKKIIKNETGIEFSLYPNKTKPNIGAIQLTGTNEIERFLRWMYKDATIYMQRKYNRYQNEFMTIYQEFSKKQYNNETIDKVLELDKIGKSVLEITKELNLNTSRTVDKILSRHRDGIRVRNINKIN